MVGPFLSKHQAPPQENAWAWNRRPLPVPQKLLQAWGACWPWWSDFHVINADGQNFVHYLHSSTASSPILLQHRPNNLFHPMRWKLDLQTFHILSTKTWCSRTFLQNEISWEHLKKYQCSIKKGRMNLEKHETAPGNIVVKQNNFWYCIRIRAKI